MSGEKDFSLSNLSVSVTSGCFVSTSSTGQLSLSSLSFSPSSTHSTIPSSLLSITAGSLSLSSIQITEIRSSQSTIDVTSSAGCSLSLSSVQFQRCAVIDQSSAPLHISVCGMPSLFTIESVTFSNCKVGSIPEAEDEDKRTERNLLIHCEDATQFLRTEMDSWTGTIDSFSHDEVIQSKFIVIENTTARKPFSLSLYLFLFSPFESLSNPDSSPIIFIAPSLYSSPPSLPLSQGIDGPTRG